MLREFGKELLVCFFVGTLPVFVAYAVGTVDSVINTLNNLNPGDPIVWYFLGLLGVHLVVYLVDKFIFKPREGVRKFFASARELTHQIGFSLHGVYRALAGAMPAAAGIMLFEEGLSSSAKALPIAAIFFLGCFITSCILTWLAKSTKPRQFLFSNQLL